MSSDDENLFAHAVLKACSGVLDLLPLAYTLRIETSDSHVYQHSRPGEAPSPGHDFVLVNAGHDDFED